MRKLPRDFRRLRAARRWSCIFSLLQNPLQEGDGHPSDSEDVEPNVFPLVGAAA